MQTAMELAYDAALTEQEYEHSLVWDEGLSVQEEPLSLVAETLLRTGATDREVAIARALAKYFPNDGTPTIERRLRLAGYRKGGDSTRDEVQELYIEVWEAHKAKRIRVLRQAGCDKII